MSIQPPPQEKEHIIRVCENRKKYSDRENARTAFKINPRNLENPTKEKNANSNGRFVTRQCGFFFNARAACLQPPPREKGASHLRM